MDQKTGVLANTPHVFIEADEEEAYEHIKLCEGVLNKLIDVLVGFALLTKRRVLLHLTEGAGYPPFPNSDTEVHIIVGAAPPGAILTTHHSHVCDIRVEKSGRFLSFWGPTRGYGTVAKDDRGPVAQIVGSNIYLFVPLPREAKFLFEGSEGPDMYTRALALAWESFGKEGPDSWPIESLDDYRLQLEARMLEFPVLLAGKIASIDEKITEATDKLVALHAEKATCLKMQTIYTTDAVMQAGEMSERDWARIKAHPLVSRITYCEDAFQIETKNILVESGDGLHSVGPVCIRMPPAGSVSIWSLGPTHPLRITHPHISKRGTACFGNITSALSRAMGEGRMADALDLILSWLVAGYDPSLANIKIEEWPLAPAQEDAAQ